ncbi:MAG: TfoX C-terminal domain, partial [Actinobacteria bacterium]|nr:TfoX C-terminal domain [Actinomycetota bacterium]
MCVHSDGSRFLPRTPLGPAGVGSLPDMDPGLIGRLAAVGVDPAAIGDPAEAWRRLAAAYGPRATLIDRYALEAAARGVAVGDLPAAARRRMALEVLKSRDPNLELAGSGRGDPVEVVPYDPAWAAAFARWREQLAAAL